MRFLLKVSTIVAICLLFANVVAAQNYGAILAGTNEVPPNVSPATGTATLTLDAAKLLHVHVDCMNLTTAITASHIHCCAAVGSNAGVKFPLIPPQPAACPIDITVGPLTATDEANLNGGLMYVNIHTTMFPGGEIRGQVVGPVAVSLHPWTFVKELYQ